MSWILSPKMYLSIWVIGKIVIEIIKILCEIFFKFCFYSMHHINFLLWLTIQIYISSLFNHYICNFFSLTFQVLSFNLSICNWVCSDLYSKKLGFSIGSLCFWFNNNVFCFQVLFACASFWPFLAVQSCMMCYLFYK